MRNASTAGVTPELDAEYWRAVSTEGHCRHESGHAVMAALCDFRVVKIIFPRAILDTNENSRVALPSGLLSENGKAWMKTFDECRALSKHRRLAAVALAGLYSQFKDCRGHPEIPRAMRSAGESDIQLLSTQIQEIIKREACSKAGVRRELKAFTLTILKRECVSRAIYEIAAAYRHRLHAGTELSGGEFCAILDGLIRN